MKRKNLKDGIMVHTAIIAFILIGVMFFFTQCGEEESKEMVETLVKVKEEESKQQGISDHSKVLISNIKASSTAKVQGEGKEEGVTGDSGVMFSNGHEESSKPENLAASYKHYNLEANEHKVESKEKAIEIVKHLKLSIATKENASIALHSNETDEEYIFSNGHEESTKPEYLEASYKYYTLRAKNDVVEKVIEKADHKVATEAKEEAEKVAAEAKAKEEAEKAAIEAEAKEEVEKAAETIIPTPPEEIPVSKVNITLPPVEHASAPLKVTTPVTEIDTPQALVSSAVESVKASVVEVPKVNIKITKENEALTAEENNIQKIKIPAIPTPINAKSNAEFAENSSLRDALKVAKISKDEALNRAQSLEKELNATNARKLSLEENLAKLQKMAELNEKEARQQEAKNKEELQSLISEKKELELTLETEH